MRPVVSVVAFAVLGSVVLRAEAVERVVADVALREATGSHCGQRWRSRWGNAAENVLARLSLVAASSTAHTAATTSCLLWPSKRCYPLRLSGSSQPPPTRDPCR